MIRMKLGDRLTYQNYWESTDKGTAIVVDVEDTIFDPFEDRGDEDLVYEVKDEVKDEETGKVFEIDDTDYFVELI